MLMLMLMLFSIIHGYRKDREGTGWPLTPVVVVVAGGHTLHTLHQQQQQQFHLSWNIEEKLPMPLIADFDLRWKKIVLKKQSVKTGETKTQLEVQGSTATVCTVCFLQC